MKNLLFFLLLAILPNIENYSQDTIVKTNGEKIICKIIREGGTSVYFTMKSGNQEISSYIERADIGSIKYGNKIRGTSDEHDKTSVGIGFGLDHGGLGGNLLFYPQKNIGIFGGIGYAFAGIGYNVGTKFRIVKQSSHAYIAPFAEVMYGYNAVILVTNGTQYNKLFYGPTFGIGLDFRTANPKQGYFSVVLLIPIRSSEVQTYMDYLKNSYGVEFKNGLLPIAFSFGYRFILN